jgi:steroid delta-isomerase-like uncharacterized protein
MVTEMNKDLMRRYHFAWSRGDIIELRALLADDCISYELVTAEERGIEHETNACETWHKSFNNVEVHIQQMIAEDDKVTVHWLLTSTHIAPFMGIEPTGKQVRIPGMEINRIQDDKIVEIWRLSDTMSVMQQLGVI